MLVSLDKMNLFEKNLLQALFVLLSFLCISFILRGVLFLIKIDDNIVHYVISGIILGGSYSYAKIKYVHFSRRTKYYILVVLISCSLLFFVIAVSLNLNTE